MENGALIRRAILNPSNHKYGCRRRRKRSDLSAVAAVVFTGKPAFPHQTSQNLFAISSVAPRSPPFRPPLDCRSRRLRTPPPVPPCSTRGQEGRNSDGDGDGDGNGNDSGDGNPLEEKKGEAQDSEEGDRDRDRDGEARPGGRVWWDFFNKRRVRVSSEKSPGEEGGERRTDYPLGGGGGGLWKLFRQAEPAKREEVSPPDGGIKLVLDGEEVEIRWRGLFDVSSPENLLAVVLAGTLALAALQIVWQLFLAVAAIALSALKYSVVAALLIGLIVFIL